MQRPRALIVIVCGFLLVVWGCVNVHVIDRGESDERIQTDVEMVRQALAEVRTLGTIFETFAIDYNRYPTSDNCIRFLHGLPLCRLETLSSSLKNYARPLPKIDPWDSPYLFWSDGQNYVVICMGGDKAIAQPDRLLEMLRIVENGDDYDNTKSHCIEDEIMFANGGFVWLPQDVVRWCDERIRK